MRRGRESVNVIMCCELASRGANGSAYTAIDRTNGGWGYASMVVSRVETYFFEDMRPIAERDETCAIEFTRACGDRALCTRTPGEC